MATCSHARLSGKPFNKSDLFQSGVSYQKQETEAKKRQRWEGTVGVIGRVEKLSVECLRPQLAVNVIEQGGGEVSGRSDTERKS